MSCTSSHFQQLHAQSLSYVRGFHLRYKSLSTRPPLSLVHSPTAFSKKLSKSSEPWQLAECLFQEASPCPLTECLSKRPQSHLSLVHSPNAWSKRPHSPLNLGYSTRREPFQMGLRAL
ncbi:unnamed protein product [Polarella glacialis]|uniref:Uncharacterized protein n=1 Tax=Polarella glacialis TaxID=89957 RepID=A0A813DQ15_POLGL|nr:unnamed protein product [Polarella glacialis]